MSRVIRTQKRLTVGESATDKENSPFFQKNQWVMKGNESFQNGLFRDMGKRIKENYTVMETLSDDDFLKYNLNPKLFCYDRYGSVDLFHVLLYVNDMLTSMEFNKQTFIALTPDVVILIKNYVKSINK
jgi:hypothetical protein